MPSPSSGAATLRGLAKTPTSVRVDPATLSTNTWPDWAEAQGWTGTTTRPVGGQYRKAWGSRVDSPGAAESTTCPVRVGPAGLATSNSDTWSPATGPLADAS